MIAVFRIAPLRTIHLGLCQFGLNSQNRVGHLGGFFDYTRRRCRRTRWSLCQRIRFADVFHQCLTDAFGLLVIFQVIIAVRHGQAALIEVRDHLIGIVQIRHGIKRKQRTCPDHVGAGDLVDQSLFVVDGPDAIQLRLQRVDASAVHRLLVHACAIEIADLLIDGVAPRSAGCGFLENSPHYVHVSLVQLYETHPLRLIRRNLGVLDPVAARVLVEIHARIDALVDGVKTEPGRRFSGRGRLREAECTKQHQDRDQTETAHRGMSP